MVKYFPRYSITTAKHAVKIEPIKYLGKYMPICLVLPCTDKAIYIWQNSIFFILHKYFSEEIIHLILEKVCIFDSSNAKLEIPLIDILYWSRFRMRVIGRCAR